MNSFPAAPRMLWAALSLVAVSFVWATTFGIVRDTVSTFPPFAFLFWRFLLASAFAVLYYFPALRSLTARGAWAGVVCGGFLFVGYAGQTVGLQTIPAARSAFLTGLFVLMVPYLAWLTLDRPLQAHIVLAAAMASLGLLAIKNPGVEPLSRGDLYTLFCALAFAGQIVALDEATRIADYRQLFVVQLLTVLVLSGAFMLWKEGVPVPRAPMVSLAIVYIALFATVLAFAVQCWAQQVVPAGEAALIFACEPVFTLFISAGVYHQKLNRLEGVGMTLILAGILVVSLVGITEARAPARGNNGDQPS